MSEGPSAAPDRVVTSGRVHVGWFDRPIADPNVGDAPAAHRLQALRGTPLDRLERAARRWRLKQWLYMSVVDEHLLFACAVVDAGYVGSAFAYVVERPSGRLYEYATLRPLAKNVTLSGSSVQGHAGVEQPGWGRLSLDSRPGQRTIEAHLEGRLGARPAPPLHARFTVDDPGSKPDPVVVVEETAPGRWLYTHKCCGLPATGRLRAGDVEHEMRAGLGGLDFNRGFRPHETWWNWAAAAGYDDRGRPVGLNLTAHRPWAAPPPAGEDAADCAFWIDGRLIKIPHVAFRYDPGAIMRPWRIVDDEGRVDLRFLPLGQRFETIDLGLVASRFHQPYGRFEGLLRDRGRAHRLGDVMGVAEQHYARW